MDHPAPVTFTRWRRLAMAPLAFILMFSYSISDNVMTDLIVYQTCKTSAGLNSSECDILHKNSSSEEAMKIEKLVQPHTGFLLVLKSCIEIIFPTILSLFLGPWSDKNGRKPLLLFPFTGYAIYYTLIAFMSNFDVNPYWYLLPSISAAILGGFPPILMTFFCYITDVTDSQNRAWHLACVETTLITGLLAGIFSGPVLFKNYGYAVVFSLSGALNAFAVFYTFFFMKETVYTDNKRTVKSIFDYSLVKELFCAVTKKRDGFNRYLICCCISAIALHVVIMEGNSAIAFLFASSKLGWDISHYSTFSGTQLSISIVGMLFLIKFVGSALKLPDTVVIILACLSITAGNTLKAFVWKPWHMYLSAGIGMFNAPAVPMIRAIISKSVPQKDLGKIFSITTVMEMTIPVATTPIYIMIYTHTLNLYPTPVWFLSAVLPLIIIVLTIIIEKQWRRLRDTQYTPIISAAIE